jgi:hypothetical protein
MKHADQVRSVVLALAFVCACSNNGTSSEKSSTNGGQGGGGGKQTTSAKGGGGGASGGGQAGSNNGGSQGGGPSCDNATSVKPCGGSIVGSWDVKSGCLKLSGEFDSTGTGLGCEKVKISGAVQVSGSFTAKDKQFQDNTTTTGSATVTLDHQCLWMSGTWTTCGLIYSAIKGLVGFKTVQCADTSDGGCTCPGTFESKGSMGLIVAVPETDGEYTTSDNTLVTGQNPLTQADLAYDYCVANGNVTLTPKTSSPTTTGSIVLQKASGSGGAGGGGGSGGKGGGGGSGGGSGGTTGKGGSGGAGTGGTTGAGG